MVRSAAKAACACCAGFGTALVGIGRSEDGEVTFGEGRGFGAAIDKALGIGAAQIGQRLIEARLVGVQQIGAHGFLRQLCIFDCLRQRRRPPAWHRHQGVQNGWRGEIHAGPAIVSPIHHRHSARRVRQCDSCHQGEPSRCGRGRQQARRSVHLSTALISVRLGCCGCDHLPLV